MLDGPEAAEAWQAQDTQTWVWPLDRGAIPIGLDGDYGYDGAAIVDQALSAWGRS